MPRESRDYEKENRSPFGRMLYEKYLEAEGKSLTQRQLVKAANSKHLTTYVLSRMVTGTFEYGEKLHIQLYDLFKGLATFYNAISVEGVQELLDTIPSKPSEHLSDTIRDHLIAQLIDEGIIKQVFYTKWRTQFIGREEDIRAVWNMLVKDKEQFVTIVGLPGVGKTELARQIEEINRGNKYFVNLTSFSIGGDDGNMKKVLDRIDEMLKKYELQQRTLLIIHNCERFTNLKEARDAFYDRVNNLKQLTILATSRATFSAKEHELKPFDVDQLGETIETLQENEAVRLFLQTANHNRKKGDEVLEIDQGNAPKIAAICKGLGGLPLALELVATRVRDLSLERVYRNLHTYKILILPHAYPDSDRQTTLFQLIKWSYDLFAPAEQKLFIRLAVFHPPCHIEAVEAICMLDDVPKEQIADFLWKLNDHHLINFDSEIVEIAHTTILNFAFEEFQDFSKEYPETFMKINTLFIHYYYDLMDKYMRVKDLNEKTQPELAEYIRLSEGEYYNVSRAFQLIILTNKLYIEEEIKNRVTKEEYDTYMFIQEKLQTIIKHGLKERRTFDYYLLYMTILALPVQEKEREEYLAARIQEWGLLILLPEMGLYNDDGDSETSEEIDKICQEIELAALDALNLPIFLKSRFRDDEILQEANMMIASIVDEETLTRYAKVYFTRIQLMNECRQFYSIKKLSEFLSLIR